MVRDAPDIAETTTAYECFSCSARVRDDSSPVECPECGGTMRNCGTPFE
ncbi:rubrerythrin-like domain-containing protein [Haloarchaeobius amylolyticus]|nr:rubrerythrin-like domain-containing protein [Haloarchaeobius amylolyticus]